MASKKSKLLIFVLFLLGLGFAGYMYKYQQIVNEGAALSNERCLEIDPLIDQKRIASYKYWQDSQASESAEVITEDITQVVILSSQVLEKSAPWMGEMQNFINRLDFQFFSGKELKELTFAQFEKYNADYEANKYMVEYYASPTEEGGKKMIDALEKMNKAQERVVQKLNAAQKKTDIRYYFIKVPPTKCAVEDGSGIPVVPAVPDLPVG